MEVCVANNHLIFSDQSGFNVTTLHKDYSLNPTGRYRLCIEFYDFDEENTITILEAKSLWSNYLLIVLTQIWISIYLSNILRK